MNIVAYSLYGQDNNAYFFLGAPESVFCPVCKNVIDELYTPARLKNVKSKYPLSFTYDGRPIVSDDFRAFCMAQDPEGAEFILVHSKPSLYLMRVKRVVDFDVCKRKTTMTNFCNCCKTFAQIAGASPGFLLGIDSPLDWGFFRTNVMFGSYREKHPQIIIGLNLKRAIEREDFRGVYFNPIYGSSTTYDEVVAIST